MAIRCNCCKRDFSPNVRPFVGKIIYGWLTEFTDKLITEGRPVALAFCKDCIDSGKVEISAWSSFSMPLHVKSNGSGFVIDFMKYDQATVKSASCEADRARATVPPEMKECPAGHRRLDEVPAKDPPLPAAGAVLVQDLDTGQCMTMRRTSAAAPAQPAQKPKETVIPGGVCSKCSKEITQSEAEKSNYVHGVPLCKECDAVETTRIIQIMRDNETASRSLTEGLGGSTKAVAFCVGTGCGGLVNANDQKASRLFFGKTLCKICIDKEKAARGGKI